MWSCIGTLPIRRRYFFAVTFARHQFGELCRGGTIWMDRWNLTRAHSSAGQSFGIVTLSALISILVIPV